MGFRKKKVSKEEELGALKAELDELKDQQAKQALDEMDKPAEEELNIDPATKEAIEYFEKNYAPHGFNKTSITDTLLFANHIELQKIRKTMEEL